MSILENTNILESDAREIAIVCAYIKFGESFLVQDRQAFFDVWGTDDTVDSKVISFLNSNPALVINIASRRWRGKHRQGMYRAMRVTPFISERKQASGTSTISFYEVNFMAAITGDRVTTSFLTKEEALLFIASDLLTSLGGKL